MSSILKILVGLAILYAAVVAVAFLAQRRLTYFPNPARVAPAQLGLNGVTEEVLATPDGAKLIAWYAPAPPGRPTLLYFHGNGGGLSGRAVRFQRYQEAGFGVLMLSWRGYSGSTGRPSEAANYVDAHLAYDSLIARGVKPADIIVYGESLGSGVATHLATEVPVGAVVLDAPFTSVADVGAGEYPYLPVRWLMTERYDSASRIARISAPLLILHGERDTVVPVAMGRRLYELAREPKKIVVFPNGHHSDLDQHGAVDVMRTWIDEIRK
jgi:fermentation-respiration switch protein FrsA (DUF1100 family)